MRVNLNLNRFFNKPQKENVNVNVDIINNPEMNKGLLDEIISNGTINNYSDEQLFGLLSNNLRGFLLNIFEKRDQRYLKMIISDRFLRVLIQVVNSIEIDYVNTIYLNNLCYDYLTLDDDYEDGEISDLIYHLARIVNKKYIPILIGLGIPEKTACYIVLSRFSSDDEFLNVTRMNFVIMNAKTYFNEQMIVDIYQNLFIRVTQLFEATMFDVVDTSEEWYTDEIDERYSLITLALLDILNSLSSEQITRVLNDYIAVSATSKYYKGKTRCDLRALSSDYSRIRSIVEKMNSDGLLIP